MKNKNAKQITFAIAGILMIASGSANAGTQTANINVSAVVAPVCAMATTDLVFGAYQPLDANATNPLLGTGTLNVTCTNGAVATIALDQGTHAADASTPSTPIRQMRFTNATNTNYYLPYFLYTNPSRTVTWGPLLGNSNGYTGTGTQTAVTIYAQIPAGQSVAFGTYTDTVTATITF